MVDKPKASPSSTYVLDDEDIEHLDGLTLTSVIRDAADVREPESPEESPPGIDDLEFDVLSSES